MALSLRRTCWRLRRPLSSQGHCLLSATFGFTSWSISLTTFACALIEHLIHAGLIYLAIHEHTTHRLGALLLVRYSRQSYSSQSVLVIHSAAFSFLVLLFSFSSVPHLVLESYGSVAFCKIIFILKVTPFLGNFRVFLAASPNTWYQMIHDIA